MSPPPADGGTFVLPHANVRAPKEATSMSLYAACDLHSNNTVLAVIDAAGDLRYRQRLPNDLSVIGAALTPFRDELTGVAVESTYNAYWLIDGLQAAGYPAVMVNTLAAPQYAGLKHGDDFSCSLRILPCCVLPRTRKRAGATTGSS